jgi:hypothetical protein
MSNKKPAILRKKYINFQKYYTLFCEYEGLINCRLSNYQFFFLLSQNLMRAIILGLSIR